MDQTPPEPSGAGSQSPAPQQEPKQPRLKRAWGSFRSLPTWTQITLVVLIVLVLIPSGGTNGDLQGELDQATVVLTEQKAAATSAQRRIEELEGEVADLERRLASAESSNESAGEQLAEREEALDVRQAELDEREGDLDGREATLVAAEAEEPEAEPVPVSEPEPDPQPDPGDEGALTSGQENARRAAQQYLGSMPFSRSGLIEQLEFEGYSTGDATSAVDALTPDWNAQAAKAAKQYLNSMPFSRSGLIEQLQFEGYTREQAEYGVAQTGL